MRYLGISVRFGLAGVVAAMAFPAAALGAQGDIVTVAGNGLSCPNTQLPCGDGGPATGANLDLWGVAATPDGGFLIADWGNSKVRKVSATGTITTVAGDGTPCLPATDPCGDGGPATSAQVSAPQGVAPTADGGFLIADHDANKVRKVLPTGVISTVAGTGAADFTGDAGPATVAKLNGPDSVAPTPDGGFLIVDQSNHRIRKVTPGGVISTVAGSGIPGYNGDGHLATATNLANPQGVAPLPDGGLLIVDGSDRVLRMSPAGIITTVVGGLTACMPATDPCGDGGPASLAKVNFPTAVALTGDGGFLISDTTDHRIRRISTTGFITSVAGTGVQSATPTDGGPATAENLGSPYDVSAMPDGGFLIADQYSERIRRVLGASAPASCGAGSFFVTLGTDADNAQKGTALRDAILGNGGADTQSGLGAADCMLGGDGADSLDGGGGKDLLRAGAGPDSLTGGPVADKLKGQAGNDSLAGGGGKDRLSGGPANDILDGGPKADVLNCGGGLDIAIRGPGDTVNRDCEFVKR